jgi:phosphate starvation-inducible PhoH-like protein
VTGDVTQIDLPKSQQSGLPVALDILKDIEGIGILTLNNSDVVRHKLVAKIITAYNLKNEADEKLEKELAERRKIEREKKYKDS